VREKYCWLVADKPSEQASDLVVAVLDSKAVVVVVQSCS
jgi:hypothetical protein